MQAPALIERYRPVWPVLNWALFAMGAAYCAAALLGVVDYGSQRPVMGDGWNYWLGEAYTSEHYRYSPAFYWLTAPVRALPFDTFVAIWASLHLAAAAWLGPWTILLAIDDVVRGNINTFLAVGLVLAVRGHAWTWSLPLLTKVTPGVGILYHVARKQYRSVLVAISVTLVIAAAGGLVDRQFWADWVDSLRSATTNYQTIDVVAPMPLRLVIGAILCAAAARWIWLLPVGMVVAMPGLWPSSFALLAAVPRLMTYSARNDTGRRPRP